MSRPDPLKGRMASEPKDVRRWTQWALFLAFLITVPVPYFMVVAGGMVPMFFILFYAVQGLIVALSKFTAEGFVMVGILWAHVVVLGGLLHIVARGLHWLVFRVFSQRHAKFCVLVLVAGLLFLASIFDIYRLPGHNYAPPATLFRVIKELALYKAAPD